MKKLLLLILFMICAIGFAQETHTDDTSIYQRAKIYYSTNEDLRQLEALGLPMDHGLQKKGHFVISEFSKAAINEAKQQGFQVEVLIEDSKEHFLRQNRLNIPQTRNAACDSNGDTYETPANWETGSMGGYLTYQEALDELADMHAQYPDLITEPSNIHTFLTNGQSDNSTTPSIGNNGIKWVKISDNPNTSAEGEAQILYTGIHHAREPITLSELIFYMWYLLENYDTDPEVQNIVNNTELYFVPVVNPDGYLYNEKTDPNGGGFWRKNRFGGYGVDNNRNYDYFINGNSNDGSWGGPGASGNQNSDVHHGSGPFSERENQAIKWFVEQHDFVIALNNHSFGQILYYPFGYDDIPTADEGLYQSVLGELSSRNGYTPVRDFPFAGESDDFMYGTVGTHDKIIAFTPEIGQQFWPPSNQIEGLCKDMMYTNITAAQMVNNYASIEDKSPSYTGNTNSFNASFNIRRLGVSGTGNFTVSINPVSNNISSAGSPLSFNGMDLLEEDSGSITINLEGGVQTGDDVVYQIVVNNGSYDTATEVTKNFGSLEEVFNDSGNSVTANFDNNGWAVTNSTFVSAPSSITDSPNGDYPNTANETITLSNPIDLTEAIGANASFYARWEIENNWDYVQFEVSTNNGGSWTPQCGNYTNPGSNTGSQPQGEPLYDGNQNDWILEEIDLSDYLGETILVRFQLISDSEVTRDGFYFDDLKISIAEEAILNVSESPTSMFTIFPNPVKDRLQIKTNLQDYDIQVYTLQGQLVSSFENVDGAKDIDYTSFAAGIYLMRLTSEGSSETFKIVKE